MLNELGWLIGLKGDNNKSNIALEVGQTETLPKIPFCAKKWGT
jgi:hypothetical protein